MGELKLKIMESTIEEATSLHSTKEIYFKSIIIYKRICQKLLKPEHMDLDWTKDISKSWIKDEYWTMLISLRRILTCEGRYVVTFLYHLRMLLHFEGGPQIDFPHFLWISLNKMVRGVKFVSNNLKTSIYHHGLMKLLIFHELRKQSRMLTGENDRPSIKRVEPVRGCLITQAVWNGPP
jgi:hypothetical protein